VPTPSQLLTEAAAAVVTTTGATRLGSDYRDDLERIPLGALRFALRGGPSAVDAEDANVEYLVETVDLELKHQLADPANERAYTEGAMQTHVAALIRKDFWRALASAHEVLSDPTYTVSREGSIVLVLIRTSISIKP